MIKRFINAWLSVVILGASGSVFAFGDGPRAYWPVPVGTNILTPFWIAADSNRGFDDALVLPNATFDTDVGVLMYTRAVSVAGHLGAISVMPQGGRVEGGFSDTPFLGESKGLGDIMALGLVNLYGAPALNRDEFRTFTPQTAYDLLFVVTAPTGDYDPDKIINLGANRWSIRVGTPILHFFDWGPGNATSLELIPNITFFSDNDDASGSASRLKQNPLFTMEAHLTHDFNKMLWGSLNGLYTQGGETSLDGIDQDNEQRSLGLGATLGVYITKTTSMNLTYGKIVNRNENGMDGSMWRMAFTYIF